jgi:hypothetical protein
MDNKRLEKLDDVAYKQNTHDMDIVYYIKKTMFPTKYGSKVRIVLNGNNILGEGSNEFIIDFDTFIQKMASRGYTVKETELFENVFEKLGNGQFTQYEKDISFLNRFCVFQRNGDTTTTTQPRVENEKNIVAQQEQSQVIDLYRNDLSVIKITCSYDIVDVLNCMNYQYYKHVHENFPINSFDDIVNVLSTYNVEYIPKFVDNVFDMSLYIKDHIHFTFYKHIVEKKIQDSSELENIEYDNWYIVLQHKKLVFNPPASIDTTMFPKTTQEPEEISPKETSPKEMSPQDRKQLCKQELDTKITVKRLKEWLDEFGLQSKGKKEELQQRLSQFLL